MDNFQDIVIMAIGASVLIASSTMLMFISVDVLKKVVAIKPVASQYTLFGVLLATSLYQILHAVLLMITLMLAILPALTLLGLVILSAIVDIVKWYSIFAIWLVSLLIFKYPPLKPSVLDWKKLSKSFTPSLILYMK